MLYLTNKETSRPCANWKILFEKLVFNILYLYIWFILFWRLMDNSRSNLHVSLSG